MLPGPADVMTDACNLRPNCLKATTLSRRRRARRRPRPGERRARRSPRRAAAAGRRRRACPAAAACPGASLTIRNADDAVGDPQRAVQVGQQVGRPVELEQVVLGLGLVVDLERQVRVSPRRACRSTSPPAAIIASTSATTFARTSSAAAVSRSRTMSYVGAVAAMGKPPPGRRHDSSTGANSRRPRLIEACSPGSAGATSRSHCTAVGTIALVAAWPSLRAPAPPLPPATPRPVATAIRAPTTAATPPPPEFGVEHTAPLPPKPKPKPQAEAEGATDAQATTEARRHATAATPGRCPDRHRRPDRPLRSRHHHARTPASAPSSVTDQRQF